MVRDGAELAVRHINEAGGIKSLGGAKLELVVFDATSDPAQSKSVVERALADKSIVAATGIGLSALTLPTLPAFEAAKVPCVGASNAPDLTNQGYSYYFRVTNPGASTGQQMTAFMEWLNAEKGANIQKVALLYENSAQGTSVADGNRARAEALGLDIVFDESFPTGITDATSIITALKNSKPDCLFIYTQTVEATLMYNTMRNMACDFVILGNANWPSFGVNLGEASDGVIAAGNWNFNTKVTQDNPDFTKIWQDFEETYGYFMTEQAGPSYETVRVIAAGIEAAASRDPVAIRDGIASINIATTQLPGILEFNDACENIHGIAQVSQWQNGKPVCIFPFEYAGATYMEPKG